MKKMDVVWLKRDVRLHDHGPFAEVSRSPLVKSNGIDESDNPFCILYLYERDQLSEPTVHGSHVHFINEGLADLDRRLLSCVPRNCNSVPVDCGEDEIYAITLVRGDCVEVLTEIHQIRPVGRILAHEETGHMKSFDRDKRMRRWCRQNNVLFVEFQQSGVTRPLRNRDNFKKCVERFLAKPIFPSPDIAAWKGRLVTDLNVKGRCGLLQPEELEEIPLEHRPDRPDRQMGGESEALNTMKTFLTDRIKGYSRGISSPNSSWVSCSRLSPYLSWGHISMRQVVRSVKDRQAELKKERNSGGSNETDLTRSLAAFLARMHWRSHFMQKLESEPEMEMRDVCTAYQPLRRQLGDWNESYYHAWATGKTGFPFVDACMRCLLRHGWINFRMRAMLVSFACWNLWLDWKRIAPHLARVFLDFEPGIHYPQLQMQAGTTGINAVRVYSVTKQGKDHDAEGVFIRKYVPELRHLPTKYIHEPWKMSAEVQTKHRFCILSSMASFEFLHDNLVCKHECSNGTGIESFYPEPIVDEKSSAKKAKECYAAIRKLESTKQLAEEVYQKHGSRQRRDNASSFDRWGSGYSNVQKRRNDAVEGGPMQQKSIRTSFASMTPRKDMTKGRKSEPSCEREQKQSPSSNQNLGHGDKSEVGNDVADTQNSNSTMWSCLKCTFQNDKPLAPVCSICGSPRGSVAL